MPSPFNLEDQHGSTDRKLVALLERLATAIRGSLQAVATAHDLSPIQVETLIYLRHHRPGGRTGLLADEFLVKQPTMSDALATLENKKLVIRERSPHDARVKLLRLTPAGTRLAEKLERWAEPYLAALAEGDEADRQQMLVLLMQLAMSLSRSGVIPVDRMCFTCRFFKPGKRAGDHHCRLLDIPLTPKNIRVDCPEHERVT